jgi:hypothetical protein
LALSDADRHSTSPLADHGRCNIGKNITRKSAGLALRGRRLARQVLGEGRSRQPMIGAAVHDPDRHFANFSCSIAANFNCCIAAILKNA